MQPTSAHSLRPFARLVFRSLSLALPRGLWPRISLLMLVTSGPLVLLMLTSAFAEGERMMVTARERLVQSAMLAAEQQDDMLQEATALLRVLARLPDLRDNASAQCSDRLGAVVADHPRIRGLAVADADGTIVCGTNAAGPGVSIADRSYFKRAMEIGNGVVVSPLTVSRVSKLPALFLATPLERERSQDAPPGVIVAALDVMWLTRSSNESRIAPGRILQVLDSRDGAVLARAPDAQRWVGQQVLDHPVLTAFKASPEGGSVLGTDVDGVGRVFGFAPLPGQATGLVLAVGLAEADISAAAKWRIWLSIVTALAAAATAVGVAWIIAKRTILRPIDALVTAVAKVGAGDMSARPAIGRGAAKELHVLGTAFTRMARRLEIRDRRISSMQHEIAVSEGHHRLLAENANDMIIRFSPTFTWQYVSPACRDLLGYAPAELVGSPPDRVVLPDDWALLEGSLNQPLLAGAPTARAIYRAVRKDGRVLWLESSGRRLEDGSGFVVVSRDVTERKALEEQLEDANRRLRVLAREDGLTGLANRRRFDEALGEEYRRAMRTPSDLALLMLDVDRFKGFNDTYGHPAGDACLKAISTVIARLARRPADLPARYGGEEFVLLLPSTDAAGALALAEAIRISVRDLAIPHSGSEAGVVTVSVGVASMIPSACPKGPAALVEMADAALYSAKHAGRDTVCMAAANTAPAA